MKYFLSAIIALALAAPLAASAADSKTDADKNARVLNSDSCNASEQSTTIQEKIARLAHELDKGQAVYTTAELQTLKEKLDDYQQFLVNMTSN